jgi:MFS family permease
MAACVINGIGAGPAETAQPTIIADIFFLHDRGKWNTLYWVVYMGSLMVGPIVSGPMNDALGWRSFWWLNVGLLGLTSAMVFFMFPETKWNRGTLTDQLRQASVTSHTDEKAIKQDGAGHASSNDDNDIKPSVTATSDIHGQGHDLEGVKTAERDPFLGKGRPRRGQWMLFQKNAHPFKSILMDLWVPWKLFVFPIVQFASFVVSWSCSSFLTLNLTQTQAFAAPPYNFSSQTIGFLNFAILVGALIGLATAGPFSDWVSMKATKKNGGIREPEMRLPAMIPYVIIMYLGNIVVSVGYENKWPWEAIVIIGYACAGIQVAALPAIASTYAVDSYKPVAGSLFVSITVNKNVWGYGFSKFITPWSEEAGSVLWAPRIRSGLMALVSYLPS